MHDANNKPLKVGDVVLVPAVITSLSEGTEDYCNVSVQSVYGRRPDGMKETMSAINTGVMMRYNKEDTIAYDAVDSVRV